MSRKLARENALLFLYEIQIQADDYRGQLERFLEDHPLNEADRAFFENLVQGCEAERNTLDEIIIPHLRNWTFERLPLLERCILRIAVFELLKCPDIPTNVILSEAVLLSKRYSDEKAKTYINGVLAKIAAEVRPT